MASKPLGAVHLEEDTSTVSSASSAGAAEGTGTESTTTQADESAAPVKSAGERRKAALTAFDIGEVDAALSEMKALLRECLALSEEECKGTTRGVLYRDVGIILADGHGDHAAAVRAMRQAVRAWKEITIPATYRSPKVTAAYDEARRQELGFVPAAPPAPAPITATPPAAGAPSSNWAQSNADKSVLLQVVGTLKAGTGMVSSGSSSGSSGEGSAGLETAVGHVSPGNLLVGGLMHVDYKWPMPQPSAEWGNWGLAGIIGGAFGRSSPTTFHYVFAGLGFEHWPTDGLTGFAFHARYGASVNGAGLGVGVNLFHTPGPYNLQVTEVLIGVHIGYADLL